MGNTKTLGAIRPGRGRRARRALLPTRRNGCLTNGGIICFSNIRQIFMKCLPPPSAILGLDSRRPLHIIHKCPVVLVIWSAAGRWQGSRAAVPTVWRGSIDRRPKRRLQTRTLGPAPLPSCVALAKWLNLSVLSECVCVCVYAKQRRAVVRIE